MQFDRHASRAVSSQEDVVRFYRYLGFFQEGSPAECTERLLQEYEQDHGEPLNPRSVWDDVYLLSYDKANVWAEDPECDVCAENEVYREVLPEWARVSKGVFEVEDIHETWQSDEGPITLTFRWNGQTCSLHPRWLQDYLDLTVLGEINRLIAGTGNQFACASDVNFAIVFLLSTNSMEKLSQGRQFPFLDLSPP